MILLFHSLTSCVSRYKAELAFFDQYVIPLARRLKDSRCLGGAADEFLSYALQNRSEWAEKGNECVQEMVRDYEEEIL